MKVDKPQNILGSGMESIAGIVKEKLPEGFEAYAIHVGVRVYVYVYVVCKGNYFSDLLGDSSLLDLASQRADLR